MTHPFLVFLALPAGFFDYCPMLYATVHLEPHFFLFVGVFINVVSPW